MFYSLMQTWTSAQDPTPVGQRLPVLIPMEATTVLAPTALNSTRFGRRVMVSRSYV